MKNFPDYAASDFDPDSTPRKNITRSRFPPDIVPPVATGVHDGSFWTEPLQSISGKPRSASGSIGSTRRTPRTRRAVGTTTICQRLSHLTFSTHVDALETTGKIKRPLITVAGTMDALLPIKHHARAYETPSDAARKGNDARSKCAIPAVRSPERQPHRVVRHAIRRARLDAAARAAAFDLLVEHVEKIPRCRRTSAFPRRNDCIRAGAAGPLHAILRTVRVTAQVAEAASAFAAVKWSGRRITGGRFIW